MNNILSQYKSVKLSFALAMVIFILLFISSGCKEKESSKLTIGLMADVGALPFLIAENQGYFEDLGLDVEIEVFKSAQDRDAGIQTGSLQGAMADMLAVFFLNDADVHMKMTSATYGNYRMVTSPNLSLTDFMLETNKKIGLSSNTVIDFATQVIGDHEAFTDELESIAIPQMPVRLEMLKSGELNGATLPEPLASLAILEGGILVGDTESLNLYPGVFIFTDEFLEDHEEDVENFYKAYNQGVDYINSEEIDAYYESLVDNLSFPPSLKDSFEMPVFEYAKEADEYTYQEIMSWMLELDLIQNSYEFESLSVPVYDYE